MSELQKRIRLANATRTLLAEVLAANLEVAETTDVEATIERAIELLSSLPRRDGRGFSLPDMTNLQPLFHSDPVIGHANPIAPPVEVVVEDGVVSGRVTLGRPYEGPPGHVHGAVIASIFDMLLGLANIASGNPSMTGTLTIKYLEPTPLHTELTIEAKTDRVDGRKVHTVGTLHAGDTLTAQAHGLFVSIGTERAAKIFSGLI
ncbi:MAG: PaaI family thioesterase [Actinomycetota bacterium]